MALKQIDHVSDDDRMNECIDNCSEAAQVAEWCADECIGMSDAEMARCIRLCRDVADITTLHARFMARNSGYHAELAGTCAELCEECADVCEEFEHNHCQACAEVLRECADSCRDMASV